MRACVQAMWLKIGVGRKEDRMRKKKGFIA